MGSYGMRIALAGGCFFLLQVWESTRAQRAYARFLNEQANPGMGVITVDQVSERRRQQRQPGQHAAPACAHAPRRRSPRLHV